MATDPQSGTRRVAVAHLRDQLDEILRRVSTGGERIVIEENGKPKAVLMSVDAYWNAIASAPDWLKAAWKAAEENGVGQITMEEIDEEVAASRRERESRQKEGAA